MSATRTWFAVRRVAVATFCAMLLPALAVSAGCDNPIINTLLGGLFGNGGAGLTVLQPAHPVRVGEQRQMEVKASGSVTEADIVSWHTSGSCGTITSTGLFTAQSMGLCSVWATYLAPATDPNNPPTSTKTNTVTFEIWPKGPQGSS